MFFWGVFLISLGSILSQSFDLISFDTRKSIVCIIGHKSDSILQQVTEKHEN